MSDGSGGISESNAYGTALAPEHRAPEPVRVVAEDVVRLGGEDEPRFLLELGLQLSRSPAGIADVDATAEHGHVDVLHESDRAEEQVGRVVGVVELGDGQHRLERDRAADVDRVLLAGEWRELRQRVADGGVGRPVEDEPHRALLAVLRDEHHGPVEVRIVEDRRRDQQLPAKGLGHDCTVVDEVQERERRVRRSLSASCMVFQSLRRPVN